MCVFQRCVRNSTQERTPWTLRTSREEEEEAEAGLLASTPLNLVEISTLSSTTTNMAMPFHMVDMIIADNGLDLFKIPQGEVKQNPHILQMTLLLALLTQG